MRRWLLVAAAALAACAQLPLGEPVPAMENIVAARRLPLAPLALGEFKLGPGVPTALDQRVVARTNVVYSPYGSSFARYLRETLARELGAAGLLDDASPLRLEGWLTDSRLDVPNGPSRAGVAARFVLRRGERTLYDKELRADEAWTASFIGVEAVPDAMNRYGRLYRQLWSQLLADPAFVAAASR